ncbi:eukaryotic translation initiation factor 5B [Paramuricea clavata]|uniref:Eukaryotic translation initiation factor 5B n=1 Tax=Paramuricea clavata TaxID=317549 RepID=A0A6S7GR26_PARCT|nr:eukaryotic translation initiation factor 5B [Paramuricea clavata]
MPQKKDKKKGRKRDSDDWEDEVANEIEQMKLKDAEDDTGDKNEVGNDNEKSKKKKKGKKGKGVVASDEEDEANDNVGSKSSFGLLDVEDIDEDGGEVEQQKKERKTKKGKPEKKTNQEDQDLENEPSNDNNVVSTTENSGIVDTGQEVKLNSDDEEDELNFKKEKRKGKKNKAKNEEDEEGEKEEGELKVKTAAQKRAEKKEREKKKKEAQKKKTKETKTERVTTEKVEDSENLEASHLSENQKTVDTQESEKPQKVEKTEEESGEGTSGMKENEQEEGTSEVKENEQEEEGDDKKKKKKKKKKVKEEEAPKTKKPARGMIKQMQEALEKAKQEQERLRQEEEAKKKELEEAENLRLEKEQQEKERKERQRQKEKERKQRLKQEGKFLTPAQKQKKAQAEAQLQAMRAQGIEIPNRSGSDVKKPVRYGYKKKQKQFQDKSEDTTTDVQSEQTEDIATEAKDENKETAENIEDKAVAGDEEGDVKDTWEDQEESDGDNATTETKQEARAEEVGEDEEEETSGDESGEESESDEETESETDDESEEDESLSKEEREFLRAEARIKKRREKAEAGRSKEKLRSPVICVMGHVDTGKTKILDKIRHSHVQDGEAGGITQQIGATNVPSDAIRQQTKMIKDFVDYDMKIPALLIIDTPGHESFSNLRSRGSTLCDMAILVVDIMHGLEPQTIESINLLRNKKTPFVVALNKVDRLYEWKRGPNSSIVDTLKKQGRSTKQEFEERMNKIIGEFAEEGLNAILFNKNVDTKTYISLVPTSAHTGDGMGDLIALIVKLCQTKLAQRLSYSEELQCTVLEVKAITGLGTTIDVILTNGRLAESQTIVLGGIHGPIITQIRALLMPQPLKELRVKNQYKEFKEIEAAQGVKITGKELDKALAGSPLFVAYEEDEIEVLKRDVNGIVQQTLKSIKVAEKGVCVQASTLGSLEALLEFLKTSKIPYCSVSVGPVHKKDVMKASVMLEHDNQFAVILAFDVKVERDGQELADSLGVKIFTADIIYHLFDKFMNYREELKQKRRDEFKHIAIFPCKLRVLTEHIFNTRDPIVLGVAVEAGIVKEGTPICVPSKEFVDIGIVIVL